MLNNVTLMGRLAHTPDVREKNEKKVAFLRLAVNRDIKGQDGVDADFFDITAFGKTAEFAEKYFQKGRQIAVVGRLQNRQYTDKDGNKRTQTSIIADHLYFADSKPQTEEREPFLTEPPREIPEATNEYGRRIQESLAKPIEPVEVSDDDLPF